MAATARRPTDIVVVGGGITGAYASYFLARAGARVVLVERGEVGGEASGTNPGGLYPLHGAGIPGPMQPLALAAFGLHRDHWPEIRARGGIDFSPRFEPRLQLALDDGERDALEATRELYEATPGFAAAWVEGGELRRTTPLVSAAVERALRVEGNARVEPLAYTRAVVAAAEAHGTRRVRAEAIGFERRSDRVTAVLTSSDAVACGGVVVATGASIEGPAAWTGVRLPLKPVRGDLLLVEPPMRLDIDVTWREAGAYRTLDGRVWLGGSSGESSTEAPAVIRAQVSRMLPALADRPVLRQLSGLRPVTDDGLPLVGAIPGWANVSLAVGGGRKGMLLSSALGLAAAEFLLQGRTALPAGPCLVDRIFTAESGPLA